MQGGRRSRRSSRHGHRRRGGLGIGGFCSGGGGGFDFCLLLSWQYF